VGDQKLVHTGLGLNGRPREQPRPSGVKEAEALAASAVKEAEARAAFPGKEAGVRGASAGREAEAPEASAVQGREAEEAAQRKLGAGLSHGSVPCRRVLLLRSRSCSTFFAQPSPSQTVLAFPHPKGDNAVEDPGFDSAKGGKTHGR
jgi:hypothetical protein